MKKSPSLANYLLLILIGIIWGSQFIFNQQALITLTPLTLAAGRIMIGAISLSLLLLWVPPAWRQPTAAKPGRVWHYYLLISMLETMIPFTLMGWGQQQVTSSVTAILIGTIPLFTLILANLLLPNERWSAASIAGVIVGFIGVIVLVSPDLDLPHGEFTLLHHGAILAAAACFALSLVLIKKLAYQSPLIIVRNILWIAALPMTLLAVIVDPPTITNVPFTTLYALLYLGIFCAGFVFVFYALLIQRAGATFTSLTNYLVPLFGTFIGVIFAHEILHVNTIIALFLIIIAMMLCNAGTRAHQSGD